MKAFNLRGTNGSGKTTVARHLLLRSKATPEAWLTPKKPLVYQGKLHGLPLFILGSYVTDCGGCDTIPKVSIVAETVERIMDTGKPGLLFYEGLMISHMIGTVGATVHKYGLNHTMGFLDTPVETCIERVVERRIARGNDSPFDPNRTLVKDYRAVRRCRENAIQQGFQVVDVPHANANQFVYDFLGEMAQ